MNKLVLHATVARIEPLRFTPAGIPIVSVVLQHTSEQIEAGMQRKVNCEINAMIMGELTKLNIQIGSQMIATGFLAKRSLKSTQLVMHINHIEQLST